MPVRRKTPEKGRPFAGRVPDPVTPATLRKPTAHLGDLVEIFPPLPSLKKVRTVPGLVGETRRVEPRRRRAP